ncbi:MAG: 16S rRNA (guanine(966)-N(2))-methyltransferase RsmD [Desulfitobacterium hafniense]|nr:16S rRNA (guanine(966)-N(2))-methyltransferase RsmD [Desulfitobacterium hafniense]
MRIIAGEMRGRRIRAVEGSGTRPTADKVKGAIFNVIQEKVEGARVLDLFAGTGSLALEAISRGANNAVLVEVNRLAQNVIQENISLISDARVKLFKIDAFSYLDKNSFEVFDIIFLDPPYHKGLVYRSLLALSNPCRLSAFGVIIAETAKDEELSEEGHLFDIRKTGEYGDTKIWYLQRRDILTGSEKVGN